MTRALRLLAAAVSPLLTVWSSAVAQSTGSSRSAPSPRSSSATGYLVTAEGTRLYYEECGSGPAIMLVHDGSVHSVGWDGIWADLCARFHVVRYDREGMGRSDAPTKPFSPTEHLAVLLADRGIASATLVGASAGGALAIDFALAHPDRVQRLVLLGPVLNGMAFSDHFLQRELTNIEPVRRGDARAAATLASSDRYVLAPGHDAARRTMFDVLVATPQNLHKRGDLVLRPAVPAAARLGEVRAPTLILVGESDIPDVHAHAGAIEYGIGGARREVVHDAGHLIQLDQPALLRDRLVAFVAETPIAAVSAERLQAVVGSYSPFARDQAGELYVKDGRLMAHFDGERDVPLFASSDSTFYALGWHRLHVAFQRDAGGQVMAADISRDGVVHRAARVAAKQR
jgi:pimeloyl-ACP methyl ester carboxylesterase